MLSDEEQENIIMTTDKKMKLSIELMQAVLRYARSNEMNWVEIEGVLKNLHFTFGELMKHKKDPNETIPK